MTQSAYTVVYGIQTPHWNIGPTYERETDAQQKTDGCELDGYIHAVSWIDDFSDVDRGYLLFRTDGIHEASWIVAEEPSELSDSMNEGAVGTTLIAAETLPE